MKISFLIQIHYTDLHKKFEKKNLLKKLSKPSIKKIFNPILIVADQKENLIIKKLSKRYKIPIIFGSKKNLILRIKKANKLMKADIYVRGLAQWYFCDLKKIEEYCKKLMNSQKLICELPARFDFRFIGDIFKIQYLDLIKKNIITKNKKLKNYFQFNPWSFPALYEKSIKDHVLDIKKKDLLVYKTKHFAQFKLTYNSILPESWDKADTPEMTYGVANNYIKKKNTNILDLACGKGSGSLILSKNKLVKKVIGLDIDEDNIKIANKKNTSHKTTFKLFDAGKLDTNLINKFDMIVSVHTMEHVKDDKKFIKYCYKYLKVGGYLVIEVPLMYKYPFYNNKIPLGTGHFREYSPEDFKRTVENMFNVIKFKGIYRGMAGEKFGNAALIVSKKSN